MSSFATGWTAADAAELDVLVHALAAGLDEHRQHCDACSPEPCPELEAWRSHKAACQACVGDAPLTFGPPCPDWRERRLEHGRACARCQPCPAVLTAVREVTDWHEARRLLSRAQALRELEGAA